MGNNLSGFNPGYYIWRDPPVYNEKPVIGPGFKDTKGKHFPPGARIPDWKSVTLKDAPELEANQRKLAALGLKDNWARYVWCTIVKPFLAKSCCFAYSETKYGASIESFGEHPPIVL